MSNAIRLIDKNETVCDIEIFFCFRCKENGQGKCSNCIVAKCIDIIQQQSTIDYEADYMINEEVFKLMECFEGSFIKSDGYLTLNTTPASHTCFRVQYDCKTKKDMIAKILEWCSRDITKLLPYKSNKHNIEWRDKLIKSLNKYLKTNFTKDDMWTIYDRLGNGINHNLTIKFIESKYDMNVLKRE